MRLAFTIGAYRLVDFVHLGICQLQKLSPDSPILVSDDSSNESAQIKRLCEEFNVNYKCSRIRRGHFANDFQALVDSLSFAQAAGADVAVKISQRTILRQPEAISVIHKVFTDPDICVATPGQPKVTSNNRASKGFNSFTTLSDLVMVRVGCITPQELLVMYRERLIREKVPWASFMECAVDDLHSRKFPGKTVKLEEFTNPTEDKIYLRRYQATEHEYRALALSHGWNGRFPLDEWGQIERREYRCRPVVV